MPLSFPLTLTDFFGPAAIASATFHLAPAVKQNRTRGGAIIRTGYATRLWTGRVNIATRRHDVISEFEAKALWLLEANASFIVTPKNQPGGSAATCQISSVSGTGQVAFKGLPANFTIPAGAFWSTEISVSGRLVRHMHRVLEPAVANATGVTPLVSILAPLEAHEGVNATVRLQSPILEAVVAVEDFSPVESAGALGANLSFGWTQKL